MPEGTKKPYNVTGYYPSNPSVSKDPTRYPSGMIPGKRTDSSAKDAQAACGFKCLASKESPFFQTINVIAAIFLAKVRRAMVGFLPLASKPS